MTSHLTDFFRLVLEASWQSSLIILLVVLIRPLMGASVPARWRYLLWALILVRLLVPITLFPSNPISMQNIAVVDRPLDPITFGPPPVMNSYPGVIRQGEGMPEGASPSGQRSLPSNAFWISWWTVAATFWLVGTLVSLGLMIGAQVLLWRRLRQDRLPVDPAIFAVWNKCCQRLRIKSSPVLRLSRDVHSPALVGLFRPVLLLPEGQLAAFSAEDWENIFVHELAHYCRADHWTHVVQLAALAVHWFNPVVWFGFRQLRADRELAADEWALQHLDAESSAAYGETLLKVVAQSSGIHLSMAAIGILEDRVQLKHRLQRIMAFGPRSLAGSLVGLVVVIAVALLVLGRPTEKVDLSDYDGLKPEEILTEASQRGDLSVLREMVREGVNVNALDGFTKQTALANAAAANQQEAMRFLLAHGADINRRMGKNPSAVEAAIENGRTECATYLLSKGAGCDPAIVAAFRGDQATLQPALSKRPADPEALKSLCRITAVNGHAALFRVILEKIKTLPGQAGWQLDNGPILTAIARGHREVVQALLDENPSLNRLNQGGVMRLGGVASETPGMREWLISKGFSIPEYTDGERLIDATEHEDLPEMDRLLKKGVDVNYRGESSWTPITKAAAWNKPRSMKFLLDHGADPNSVHLPGWDYTAICLTSRPAIADRVLAAGGNINATLYKRGVHIMDYSVTFGATDMVKWYIAHGVDPIKVQADRPDRTFLFDAGNPEIAEILIRHGVKVNARDKDGITALSWICMFGKKPAETVRVLLQHGADPNAADNQGITPLMRAKDGATVDVLVQYGANVHARTKDGESLLASGGAYADPTWMQALIRHGATVDIRTDGLPS
jgi:beta-lactamase regulating signal transducer with metallopeptidase domain/ankyrin repeat protein